MSPNAGYPSFASQPSWFVCLPCFYFVEEGGAGRDSYDLWLSQLWVSINVSYLLLYILYIYIYQILILIFLYGLIFVSSINFHIIVSFLYYGPLYYGHLPVKAKTKLYISKRFSVNCRLIIYGLFQQKIIDLPLIIGRIIVQPFF